VIPRAKVELDANVPDAYSFWTPSRDDISDEGFGYFRSTWLIRGVTATQAREMIESERELVALADRHSRNAEQFDAVARVVERDELEDWPDELMGGPIPEEFVSGLHGEGMSPTEGLDLGVAGLVYALSAAGCWPAASCRGHGPGGWAQNPVVYLAADRHRVSVLQPLIAATGCGLDIDNARGELLVIIASSIKDMMALAQRVVDRRKQFPRSRPRPPAATDTANAMEQRAEQLRLDGTQGP
jgi:hypothetical protein